MSLNIHELTNTEIGRTPREERQYILIGGYILQVLTLEEMILRRCYFEMRGTHHVFEDLEAHDLIQICPPTQEVIISRDNSIYYYNRLAPKIFNAMVAELMENEYKPEGE